MALYLEPGENNSPKSDEHQPLLTDKGKFSQCSGLAHLPRPCSPLWRPQVPILPISSTSSLQPACQSLRNGWRRILRAIALSRQQLGERSGESSFTCRLKDHSLRPRRSDLTLEERKEYTDAVLCLMEKPALTSDQAPGAKSRFDDYVVIHLLQTPRNHGSVSPRRVL